MNVGHVSGGTGAGSKRSLKEQAPSWQCKCVIIKYQLDGELTGTTVWAVKWNEGWLQNCPRCWTRRPS